MIRTNEWVSPQRDAEPRSVRRAGGQRWENLPPVLYALSFPRWKWPHVRRCFPDKKIHFISRPVAGMASGALLLWGTKTVSEGLPSDVSVVRMEDGFLRSVGLGAELAQPLSWVVDTRGIYYDATRPSDLEHILQHTDFSASCVARARALRHRIVDAGITKYNVGHHRQWWRPSGAQRIILVPGQVETDASILYGSPRIRRNMDLLRQVREENPEAYIVYKPHPDVVARLRIRGENEDQADRWCNEIITDIAMEMLLKAVDEVHVLTSLAGFEALLREKPVTCYGQPFYSGWGLTQDKIPHPRRHRRLTLDQLVAGTLLHYPLYLGRGRMGRVSPEEVLMDLTAWKRKKGDYAPFWQGAYRFLLRRFIGVR